MAASPAQIAANRLNAQRSTGPNTVAGKEAARRNALKHGLSGGGVVIPGEDEHEVAIRVAALEQELAPEGSVVATLLLRQVAIASIRVERAYRHETALAGERTRKAMDVHDDSRKFLAERIIEDLRFAPETTRRRLLAAPEGIDLLIGRLQALRAKAEPGSFLAWDVEEGAEFDQCLGLQPGQIPLSRAALLTRGVAFDHWVGLDPAEFADLTGEPRRVWAVREIHALITAEIAALTAHRATLDLGRFQRDRAEASERTLLELKTEGTAIRRYTTAAERSMLNLLKELRVMRFETRLQGAEPAEAAEAMTAMVAEMPPLQAVEDELAPFCTPPRRKSQPKAKRAIESAPVDPKSSFVPITVGQKPRKSTPPPT